MTTVKPDKLTEKAFTQSIAVSIICVLLCAVALCSATWAWFKGDVTSSDNTIKAGYCNVTIEVKDGDTTVPANVGTAGVYTFEAGKTYTVTVTSEGDVKSSYCKLVIGGEEYYTQQISTHAPGNVISFTLTFDADTTVQIPPCRYSIAGEPTAESSATLSTAATTPIPHTTSMTVRLPTVMRHPTRT